MAPEVSARHPLNRVTRLFLSRGMLLALGVVALGFCVFAGIDASKVRPNDGTVWLLGRPELIILDVPPRVGAPPSPLQPGDRIVGIGNKLVRSPQDAASLLSQQKVGASVDYLIEREGEMREEAVLLTPFRAVGRTYLYHVLLAAAYALIGFLVYLRSRNDQAARLFFLLCLTFTVFFITNQNRSSYFWGDIITQNGGALARFLLPALFLHFFLVFPEKKLILTRHPFLEPLIYLLPGMFYVRFALDQFFGERGASIGTTDWLILGLYFASGLVALLHGYFSYRDPLQKERVRILTIGTLTGVLPFLLFKVGLESVTDNEALGVVGQVPLLAIPVSFGYCIARYRVMQIELLIKRSLVYTLLTAGVLLVYLSLVLVLGGLILKLSGPTSQLVSVGATLIIAAALWPARTRIQNGVDRKFFRARNDMTAVLQAISKEIPRLIQRDALLERVGQRLRETLDVPRLAVYLRTLRAGQPRWTLASSNLRDPDGLRQEEVVAAFPEELFLDAIARIIARRNEPFWTEPPRKPGQNPHLAITREQAELTQRLQEQDSLASADIALLVPLATQGRLIGLIALPFKPGDEAYRLPELELLTLVAGQLALQVENARLYEEEVAKQKLEEEMAMARTIQSRLLPGHIPHVPGAELQAVNISSRQVSGDYYDVIEREDGWLGLVISDVSGKGMPASLLASSLQAAMRAQCDTGAPPRTVMARVNRQLHASTDPQHFATLFLAFYHPGKRILCYSCGGHNAPILLRKDGTVELLEKGGLPLGAFDFGDYDEDTVHLEQGDLLFMYTDGLTETKNSDDEDYGTERLEAFLRTHRELPADQILGRVHQAVQDFCGREDADDDITMIALKITGKGISEEGEPT